MGSNPYLVKQATGVSERLAQSLYGVFLAAVLSTIRCVLQGADYTALGSFGNAEQFGENLVASLDRSFMLKSGFNRPKSVQVGASCSPVPISRT